MADVRLGCTHRDYRIIYKVGAAKNLRLLGALTFISLPSPVFTRIYNSMNLSKEESTQARRAAGRSDGRTMRGNVEENEHGPPLKLAEGAMHLICDHSPSRLDN